VYSDADAGALHVQACDEAVRLGPAPARESYLDAAKVIAAAKQTGARAIHPGYGFLSEQADFAQTCSDNNITFIGPPPSAMRALTCHLRHQKLVEAAPATAFELPQPRHALREKLLHAGLRAAQAVGYANAGTAEFLLVGDEFFFIELNARLQVEHPVTEATTG